MNAKELLMAKVNATPELASMHIYLMILGFTPEQVVEIMTSDVMEDVIESLEGNIFFSNEPIYTGVVLSNLQKKYSKENNTTKLTNLKMLTDVYDGAQEIKILSKLLGVNQKTSANIEEINKYLNTFETTMFAREHAVFGFDLGLLNDLVKNEASGLKSNEFDKGWEKIFNKILTVNKTLKLENGKLAESEKTRIKEIFVKGYKVKVETLDYKGKKVIINAGIEKGEKNTSVFGGNFDFRYFIQNGNGFDNSEYIKASKEYYNLIKNTVNIFDVIDEVPHFKEMINGLKTAHNTLLNTSFKYRTAFSIIKDFTRENAPRIIFGGKEVNPGISNQMGNPNFPPALKDKNVNGLLNGVDILLRSAWLKSKNTEHLVFSVKDLLSLSGQSEIDLYISDDAILDEADKKTLNVKTFKVDDAEDFEINLKTNHGIANFKKITEELFLPLIQNTGDITTNALKQSLKVESIRTQFGKRGNVITSTFPLGDMRSPISLDKFQRLMREFNNLDIKSKVSGKKLTKGENKNIKFRDVFYLYNLLVNNEKYGNKRLTPMFGDDMKNPNSLAYDYVIFSSNLDSGKLDILDYSKNVILESMDSEDRSIAEKNAYNELVNDLLHYTFNDGGRLSILGFDGSAKEIKTVNTDFVLPTSLTETKEQKKRNKELSEILDKIKNGGFIIKFSCT